MSDFDDFDPPFEFQLDPDYESDPELGTVMVADMATGPIVLGIVPHPPLTREVITGLARALAPDNAGRPPGVWVMPDCPIRYEAITVRATFGAG